MTLTTELHLVHKSSAMIFTVVPTVRAMRLWLGFFFSPRLYMLWLRQWQAYTCNSIIETR